jgi:hypothetical protein
MVTWFLVGASNAMVLSSDAAPSADGAREESTGPSATDKARKRLRPRTRNAPRWDKHPFVDPDTSSPEWLAYIAGDR